MPGPSSTISLTRRLVGHYLAFGLACLLLCLAAALTFAFRGELSSYAPLIALVPVAVLAAGAFVVYQTSRLSSQIASQLHAIAEAPSGDRLPVDSIPQGDLLADGWNKLIKRVGNDDAWRRLEEKIGRAADQTSSGEYEQLFTRFPLAVAVTDLQFRIVLANRSFVSLTRHDAGSNLVGRSILDLLPVCEGAEGEEVLHRIEGYQGATTFDLHQGKRIDEGILRISRTPWSEDGADANRQVWIVRDVTQQLLAEEMRNQFVFTATHELRTPLSNIKAYAELLDIEEGIDVEKQKEFCNIINAEATRLARFVDELLNISQMEAGALAVQRHEVNLESLVADIVENVSPEFEKKQITFETKLPSKWPKLNADKDKLESALVNLLGNAAKYTSESGHASLEIELGDNEISFLVEDAGIGIAEDELPHVFDTFFRSDDVRVQQISGNGLGLAFAQEVARLHGGRLTVHSELGKGSLFTFTLPRA